VHKFFQRASGACVQEHQDCKNKEFCGTLGDPEVQEDVYNYALCFEFTMTRCRNFLAFATEKTLSGKAWIWRSAAPQLVNAGGRMLEFIDLGHEGFHELASTYHKARLKLWSPVRRAPH